MTMQHVMQLACSEPSSPTNSPEFLFNETQLGDNGLGIFVCDQSTPLDVATYTFSPTITGESWLHYEEDSQFHLMSYIQRISASNFVLSSSLKPFGFIYSSSFLKGPSFPSMKPLMSRQTSLRIDS